MTSPKCMLCDECGMIIEESLMIDKTCDNCLAEGPELKITPPPQILYEFRNWQVPPHKITVSWPGPFRRALLRFLGIRVTWDKKEQ